MAQQMAKSFRDGNGQDDNESPNANIFFSVGEPSGDLHASKLIAELRNHLPGYQVSGFGGPLMRQAGCRLDYELTNLAVVGIVEVLPKLREFFRVADLAEEEFRKGKTKAVVLVDFPGFNFHIAKRAKKYGIPVYYYLPPQLWAWAGWRIRKIRRWVDHVLCNLPFEPAWYRERGVQVQDVGHPFFDEVAQRELDKNFLATYRQQEDLKVAVLPGSRGHEVSRNWPVQLEVIRRLHQQYPNIRFLVAAYREKQRDWCQREMSESDRSLPIDFYVGKTSEIIEVSDFAFMVSGSVSLELMARGTPALVIYRPSRLTYMIGKSLASCRFISLPNLIADKEIMHEMISVGSPEKAISALVEESKKLIEDKNYRLVKKQELLDLNARFAQPGATLKAATFIAHTMKQQESIPVVEKAA